MASHIGSESTYRGGCRCVRCKAAHAEKCRHDRARSVKIRTRQSRSKSTAKVVAMPTSRQTVVAATVMGENEAAIRQQAENSPRASERPGTVQQCITLSKILDNPEFSPMWAQVSRQIHALLTSLEGSKRKGGNRLAAVVAMTARR
jgi:hypothetical protein